MSDHSSPCPVCKNQPTVSTVKRHRLPAMQNYVYRSAELAHAVKPGQFALTICESCGFAFNGQFDPELLTYDEGYDNSVPSMAMANYYGSLADYFNKTYLHDEGFIVDVGCGKGTFLKALCEKYPNVRGLGIDPSYEGDLIENQGRLRFIRDFFAEGQLQEKPSLVICRHVLEHIPQPVEFLATIHEALRAFPDVPVFVEVPDLGWILKERAFWDYCYEHCNYFTPTSLATAATLAGMRIQQVRAAFGDQYMWLEARTSCLKASVDTGTTGQRLISEAMQYVRQEDSLIENAREHLLELKRENYQIVLWGMATKGTLFSYLVDPKATLIDYRIDINPNKQGCYTPIVGHRIDAPSVLQAQSQKPTVVIVMNENYWREILSCCEALGVDPILINAACQTLGKLAAAS